MAWQGLANEFLQVPAVTRTYTAACVLTTAAVVSRGRWWGSAAVVTAPGGCQGYDWTLPHPHPAPLGWVGRGAVSKISWFRSSWNSSVPSSSTSTRTSCSGSSR